jgi:uncharacterized protein YdeI (YjbR/CyaY-like superfamily)
LSHFHLPSSPDLNDALSQNASANARWEKLSFTHKRELAEAILEAKKPDTRMRRLQKTLEMLTAKPANPR